MPQSIASRSPTLRNIEQREPVPLIPATLFLPGHARRSGCCYFECALPCFGNFKIPAAFLFDISLDDKAADRCFCLEHQIVTPSSHELRQGLKYAGSDCGSGEYSSSAENGERCMLYVFFPPSFLRGFFEFSHTLICTL